MGAINSRCPSNLWEDFVQQMEITLAHLRPFADDSTVSSWEGIHGHKYNFLAHPISVCGTAVYVFESTDVRATWDCHGQLGFYVGPALDSYRAYRCHVTATNRIRITNTVQFFPDDIPLPATRLDDAIARTVSELSSQNKTRVLDLAKLLRSEPQSFEANEPDPQYSAPTQPEQKVPSVATDVPVQRVQVTNADPIPLNLDTAARNQ